MILYVLGGLVVAALVFYGYRAGEAKGRAAGWQSGVTLGRALGREAGYRQAREERNGD